MIHAIGVLQPFLFRLLIDFLTLYALITRLLILPPFYLRLGVLDSYLGRQCLLDLSLEPYKCVILILTLIPDWRSAIVPKRSLHLWGLQRP